MAVLGLFWPRDHGGSFLWTRLTPSALVQRSADPNRTIFEPVRASAGLGTRGDRFFGPVSPSVHLSRGRRTHIGPLFNHFWVWGPSLKVDRMRHGPTKPRHLPKMVRCGSADLRTSALGVKRVRGSVSPCSRARIQPKKAPNGQNSKICHRSGLAGPIAVFLKSAKTVKIQKI